MVNLTPTERLILFALILRPRQSALELQASTGTKTLVYLGKGLARLIAEDLVTGVVAGDGITIYTVTSKVVL